MLDLLGGFWPKIIALGTLLFGAIGAWLKMRAGVRKEVTGEMALKSAERVEKGLKGAAEARKDLLDGKTPEDILRENDGAWGQ